MWSIFWFHNITVSGIEAPNVENTSMNAEWSLASLEFLSKSVQWTMMNDSIGALYFMFLSTCRTFDLHIKVTFVWSHFVILNSFLKYVSIPNPLLYFFMNYFFISHPITPGGEYIHHFPCLLVHKNISIFHLSGDLHIGRVVLNSHQGPFFAI